MPDVIFVAAGQCGNQLGLALLNSLRLHASDKRSMAQNADGDTLESLSRQRLIDTFFRDTSSAPAAQQAGVLARAVCLDTEPKVIDECLRQTQSGAWSYDSQSVAYRHGGAGNNWALGYAMASDEFLQISLNCVRKQLERCDSGACLVFLHSLAGGTGSGLGTRLTEACRDAFGELQRFNVAIAPHHFGEVVVQYYNALLCLAKVSSASDGVMVFENEVAQQLCREMHGIEKPLLRDLNHVITSNLLPLFVPKLSPASDLIHGPVFSDISHDITHLCSHPRYRFVNVKLSPQTSKKSIDFTFDSWPSLLKTIQRLQLSGTPSERHIIPGMKHAGSSPQGGGSATTPVVRALASTITCHGKDALSTTRDLFHACRQTAVDVRPTRDYPASHQSSPLSDNAQSPAKGKVVASPGHSVTNNLLEQALLGDFLPSHNILLPAIGQSSVTMNASLLELNRYQRSCSIVSNDQSILPMLQRPWQRSKELFDVRAYLHQYTTHGLEEDDFASAFRSISATIHSYSAL